MNQLFFILKNKAYNIGIKSSVISVLHSNPPMIAAAKEPNMASDSKGMIPRIVVSEAIMTGRRRLWELSISAVIGSTPSLIIFEQHDEDGNHQNDG